MPCKTEAISADVRLEIDRIVGVWNARQKDCADQFEAYKIRTLKRRLREFEAGRREMCKCENCLSGYILLDESRFCFSGQEQFRYETKKWRPNITT